MKRSRTIVAIALAAGLVGAACSGGDDDSLESGSSSPTSSPSSSSGATTTTRPSSSSTSTPTDTETTETDTTESSSSTTASTAAGGTSTTVLGPTTTLPAGPVHPLTGLPITDDTKGYRAALVVKIDNHPQARPQTGLNNADIVFEENVEQLTRFAAVFQSDDSDPVGPVRSGRLQDVDLLGLLNRPLLAWSGGNPTVTRAIRASDLINVSWTVAGNKGGYYRSGDTSKDIEHTLFARTPLLFQNFTPVFAPPPPQLFTYRAAGEAFNGEANKGADLKMDGVAVNWLWDTDTAQYLRSQAGKPHTVAGGGQVDAANVIILEVEYRSSAADTRSREAVTLGAGSVYVLTAGVMIEGTWERADRLATFTLKDLDGNVIALTPGRTWVELAKAGVTTLIT